MHHIALTQQELRQVGAILPGNTGDQRNFRRIIASRHSGFPSINYERGSFGTPAPFPPSKSILNNKFLSVDSVAILFC